MHNFLSNLAYGAARPPERTFPLFPSMKTTAFLVESLDSTSPCASLTSSTPAGSGPKSQTPFYVSKISIYCLIFKTNTDAISRSECLGWPAFCLPPLLEGLKSRPSRICRFDAGILPAARLEVSIKPGTHLPQRKHKRIQVV